MGRFFSVLCLTMLLLSAGWMLTENAAEEPAQAVFFRMLFPQLMPDWLSEATPGEASVLAEETIGEAVAL